MIYKQGGALHRWPKGDINKIIEDSKFQDFAYTVPVTVRFQPSAKHIARNGVDQSDLNYRGDL